MGNGQICHIADRFFGKSEQVRNSLSKFCKVTWGEPFMVSLKGKRKWLIVVAIVALIVLAVCWALRRECEVSEGHPNGFPLLVEASQQIVGTNPILQQIPPTKEHLQKFIAANQTPLRTLRKALTMPCIARSEIELLDITSNLEKIANLFVADGELQKLRGDFNAAARSYFDAIRLGMRLKVKWALPSISHIPGALAIRGQIRLAEILPNLSASTATDIASELLKLLETEDPLVLRLERKISRRAKFLRTVFALTTLELALHAFRQKERRLPKTLDELVPEYLPKLPKDELSGKPFVYGIINGKVQVYSVGCNGRDDNGKGDDVTARLWERFSDAAFQKAYFVSKSWAIKM